MINSPAVKEVVFRHWNSRAATFDEAPNHGLITPGQRTAWIERVSEWAGSVACDAIDVGCGTGFLALILAGLGHRVVGVDAASNMLDRALAKAELESLTVDFRLGDAELLPCRDTSADLVVERHVIWTLPNPSAALADWLRVLRPGGRLVLVEGDWRSAGHADYAEIRDALPLYGGRPASVLSDLVREVGFIDVEVELLMDAVLWGKQPDRGRYALIAQKHR
ncbi:MAG: methyltransferase domain-containing protein [Chloroflexota bacterium]